MSLLRIASTQTDARTARDTIRLMQMLLTRLERVSVDSYWAHRASGVRGSLLRAIEALEGGGEISPQVLQSILEQGFRILERAAHERVA